HLVGQGTRGANRGHTMSAGFFDMGGYAFYVWFSYGVSAAVLVLNAWWAGHREKTLLANIARESHEHASET
ncbi:MAG: heme exporter protein CcmD, partial [Gammaproteobacteria bacterium]